MKESKVEYTEMALVSFANAVYVPPELLLLLQSAYQSPGNTLPHNEKPKLSLKPANLCLHLHECHTLLQPQPK